MNATALPEVFSSVFGTDLSVVLGLAEKQACVIEASSGKTDSFDLASVTDGFTPVGDVSVRHDLFVFAHPPGTVTAVRISSRKMIWQKSHRGLISNICIIDASGEIVLDGTTVKVVQVQDGERVASPLSGYHSHVKAGAGSVCIKNRTLDQYYVGSSSRPGLHFQFPAKSWKEAFSTPHFVALAEFESTCVTFVDPAMGTIASRVAIPDCALIDALGYDSKGDALLAASHSSTTKRIEVWRLTVMGEAEKISVFPEGVGTVGWTFRIGGSQLLSRSGRLVDVASGKLLKNSWAEWRA